MDIWRGLRAPVYRPRVLLVWTRTPFYQLFQS